MKVHCRQNLLTLRVCWELDFLRTVAVCPANSLSGKEKPPGVDRQSQRRGILRGQCRERACLDPFICDRWPTVPFRLLLFAARRQRAGGHIGASWRTPVTLSLP